jgi:hypothetical protein
MEASEKENKIISYSYVKKKTLLSEQWVSFPAILETEAFGVFLGGGGIKKLNK